MLRRVERKLGLTQDIVPVILRRGHHTAHDLFHTAMEALALPVRLWVEAGGQRQLAVKARHQTLPKVRQKPRVPIRNDFGGHPKFTHIAIEKQLRHIRCANTCHTRHKGDKFAKPIDHCKHGVMALCRSWQRRDQIHRHLLKWTLCGRQGL